MQNIISEQLLHTVFYLAIVLVIFVGLAYLAKRLHLADFKHNKEMKIISGLALSRKEKLMLVKVKDKELLIGVSSGAISTLHVFNNELEV